jgi:hypothetical protein
MLTERNWMKLVSNEKLIKTPSQTPYMQNHKRNWLGTAKPGKRSNILQIHDSKNRILSPNGIREPFYFHDDSPTSRGKSKNDKILSTLRNVITPI